jgi:hypothetical protein
MINNSWLFFEEKRNLFLKSVNHMQICTHTTGEKTTANQELSQTFNETDVKCIFILG